MLVRACPPSVNRPIRTPSVDLVFGSDSQLRAGDDRRASREPLSEPIAQEQSPPWPTGEMSEPMKIHRAERRPRPALGRWSLLVLCALGLSLAVPSLAQATNIVVDTTAATSPGHCTLSDAIEAASSDLPSGACPAGSASATDVIEFALPAESVIESQGIGPRFPTIEGDTRIVGPGPGRLTIDGEARTGLFEVADGEVTLSGLRLTRAFSEGDGLGTAITNLPSGELTLENVMVDRCHDFAEASETAGAIDNEGSMTIADSSVLYDGNSVEASEPVVTVDGAIVNRGQMRIERSTIAGSKTSASGPEYVSASGGGIDNDNELVVSQSLIAENYVQSAGGSNENWALGGGIVAAPWARTEVIDSTVVGNHVEAGGTAPHPGGGGLVIAGSSYTVRGSTIASNYGSEGANLDERTPGGTFVSSLVADPHEGPNCLGTFDSLGFNLESEDTCGFAQATDQVDTDPLLAPALADNGGPTMTLALLPGSPALDRGDSGGEVEDQRGLPRPVDLAGVAAPPGGDGSDVGAYELQVPSAIITAGPAEGATLHERTVSFSFAAEGSAVGFECSLDGATPAPCSSPATFSGLSDGSHRFAVVADAPSGYHGATATTRAFAVEAAGPASPASAAAAPGPIVKVTAPPTAKILGLPGRTYARRLRIRLGSDQPGSTFTCKLDHRKWTPCRSPHSTGTLSVGRHAFAVRATNPAGQTGATVHKAFTVRSRPAVKRHRQEHRPRVIG